MVVVIVIVRDGDSDGHNDCTDNQMLTCIKIFAPFFL